MFLKKFTNIFAPATNVCQTVSQLFELTILRSGLSRENYKRKEEENWRSLRPISAILVSLPLSMTFIFRERSIPTPLPLPPIP